MNARPSVSTRQFTALDRVPGCVTHSLGISVPSQWGPTEEIHWSVFDRHTQATALRSFAFAARADRRKNSPVSGFVMGLAAAAAAAVIAAAIHSSVYE